MNSALKPVLQSPGGPQNSGNVPAQINKPSIHPTQNQQATYGQPTTGHMVNMPPNTHPNPAHQQNHYSINVPNASQHFNSQPSIIPASNHPVVSNVSQAAGMQFGTSNAPASHKNYPYSTDYQQNFIMGPRSNQNYLPPVSQTLPPTQPQSAPVPQQDDKPQSNGTSPTKPQENHILPSSPPKDKPLTSTQQLPQSPLLTTTTTQPSSATIQQQSTVATTTTTTTPSSSTEKNDEKPSESSIEQPKESSSSSTKIEEKKEETTITTSAVTTTTTPTKNESPNETTTTSITHSSIETNFKNTTDLQSPIKQEKEDEIIIEKMDIDSTQEEDDNDNKSSDKGESQKKEIIIQRQTSQQQQQKQKTPTKTVRSPTRKSRTPKDSESPKATTSKQQEKTTPTTTTKAFGYSTKSKRQRTKTQPYQSPLPEIEIITKISSTPRIKSNDDKVIVFYKNEFLAVRNSEGSFYICQAVQNIYKSSPKIRIRWLSQEKNEKSGEIYTPDFYDNTDFDCILTNLNLERVDKARFRLPPTEKKRTDSILRRSLAVEKGEVTSPSLTEEHPDGIDVSLYKEEKSVKRKKRGPKRRATSALKIQKGNTTTPTTKSPDEPKVKKVGKKPGRKPAATTAQLQKADTTKLTTTPSATTSNNISSSATRSDRAKRRSDNQNYNNKVTPPVVDQKKAKVLAKVAKKTAVPALRNNNKNSKTANKTTAAVSSAPATKVQRAPPPKAPAAKRSKKRSRK